MMDQILNAIGLTVVLWAVIWIVWFIGNGWLNIYKRFRSIWREINVLVGVTQRLEANIDMTKNVINRNAEAMSRSKNEVSHELSDLKESIRTIHRMMDHHDKTEILHKEDL